MVLSVGDSHLDVLFQKSLRYNHHKENYQISLSDGIIPSGLRIKKELAFVPVTEDFHSEWNSVLFEAEKRLVRLLLRESEKVIAKIEVEFDLEIEVEFDQELELQFPGTAEQKKFEIANKHQAFKNNLFTRRKKNGPNLMNVKRKKI